MQKFLRQLFKSHDHCSAWTTSALEPYDPARVRCLRDGMEPRPLDCLVAGSFADVEAKPAARGSQE